MPTRRQVLQGLAASALAPALGSAQRPRKPNILYVFSDQHRACSMPGEDFNDAEAPLFARLAAEGISFNSCISNYPVCSPYRGILMTGRWPCETGIVDNRWPLRQDEVTLGEVFQRNGYRTGYIGKWHLDGQDEGKGPKTDPSARHGFDDWMAWYDNNRFFESYTFDRVTGERKEPGVYNAIGMTDDAIGFIERNRDESWMLAVSWNPPHPPFLDGRPELMKKYEPGAMQLRPNSRDGVARSIGSRDSDNVRKNLAGYNAHIEGIDIEMGRLLKTLEETGLADNTVIVYTSDHGEMLGSHRRMGKRLPHDESCRVPFLVRYPGVVPAGAESDVLLSAIDIYPTLCGLAGIEAPSHCRGRDLSAAVRGEPVQGPEAAFLMHIQKANASGGRNHPAPVFRGVRTKRYTYAVGEVGRWCLYDDQEDPYQQHNLADDSSRASLMSELDGEVLRFLDEAKDRFPYETLRAKRSIVAV